MGVLEVAIYPDIKITTGNANRATHEVSLAYTILPFSYVVMYIAILSEFWILCIANS